MAHDSEKTEEYEGAAKQAEAFTHSRCLVRLLFVDRSGCQERYGEEAYHGVDYKQRSPAESECGENGSRTPCGDNGSQKRGDSLYKLAEGEG